MGAKTKVLVVLAASAVLAGTFGIQSATGQKVLHLVLPGNTQTIREVDHDGGALRLGDRVAARGSLTDAEGMPAGTSYADCVVQRRISGPESGLGLLIRASACRW